MWDGELYLEMHRGTFTTKSDLKRINRRLEYKFRTAEMLSVLRNDNVQEKITALYKKLLVNQFHDILPGSHINPVYKDAMADYVQIEKELDLIIHEKGNKYFNTLNIKRDALTFVKNKREVQPVTMKRAIGLCRILNRSPQNRSERVLTAVNGSHWRNCSNTFLQN